MRGREQTRRYHWGFLERHPTLLRRIVVAVAVAALVYLTLQHLVLTH